MPCAAGEDIEIVKEIADIGAGGQANRPRSSVPLVALGTMTCGCTRGHTAPARAPLLAPGPSPSRWPYRLAYCRYTCYTAYGSAPPLARRRHSLSEAQCVMSERAFAQLVPLLDSLQPRYRTACLGARVPPRPRAPLEYSSARLAFAFNTLKDYSSTRGAEPRGLLSHIQ